MDNLSISILFIATTIATLVFLYKSAQNSKRILIFALIWLVVQAFVSYSGFYTITKTSPPRFLLLVFPPMFIILLLFTTKKGKKFIEGLNPKTLSLLHVVRIPVEIVLYLLAVNKLVPELMTFDGRNFDILSGITAPIVYYFGYIKNVINKRIVIAWNLICLALLFNIVINAVLSLPTNFQQFAFDQPNIAIMYFPFVWLPCFVVPVVLFAHLVSLRALFKS